MPAELSDIAFQRYEALYEKELYTTKAYAMFGHEHQQYARRKVYEAIIAECSTPSEISSRDSIIEECAKVCDKSSKECRNVPHQWDYIRGCGNEAESLAVAIRALKNAAPQGKRTSGDDAGSAPIPAVAAPASEIREPEGYSGIAHDFETMREALITIRDECFSGNAYDIAVRALTDVGGRGIVDGRTGAPQPSRLPAPTAPSSAISLEKLMPRDPTSEMLDGMEAYYRKWQKLTNESDDSVKAAMWSWCHAYRAAFDAACTPPSSIKAPIDMLLFCPRCQHKHIDAPEPERGWTNPPHSTHTCQFCGLNWRPSNALTNGVDMIEVQEPKHGERIVATDPLEHANRSTETLREPTPAMQQAGVRELRNHYWTGTDFARVCAIYRAMMEVAPPSASVAREDGKDG